MDKDILTDLYTNKKCSVRFISEHFSCSQNKVNYWLKKHKIQKRSISDAMYVKRNPNGDPFKVLSPSSLNDAVLYGIGLGLYWGEGNKANNSSIRLGNGDPRLIKKFIEFLEKAFLIKKEKIRFGLQIFSDISKNKALNFWAKELSVSKTQFQKVVVTPPRGQGTYKRKLKFGVLTVYYNNIKLLRHIKNLIENI